MNFKAVIIVDNLVTGLKVAVVKILFTTDFFRKRYSERTERKFLTNLSDIGTWIYIMCESTSCYTSSVVDSSHVVEDGV